MMEEIEKDGPIICGITTSSSFLGYKGGILADNAEGNINHYVSIYGWGEETDEKNKTTRYWLGQNSYGPTWGEQGNFRIIRGHNVLNVETLCSLAIVKTPVSTKVVQPFAVTASISQLTPNFCHSSWAFSVLQSITDG